MFRRVVHCDWSKNPGGRWQARAWRDGAGWRADGPSPVPADMPAFVADLLDPAQGPTLAAFDFPIGLPLLLRGPMGGGTFPEALRRFGGAGALHDVLRPAATPEQVGPLRPFYPDRTGAARQAHLLDGLGAARLGELMRGCERAAGPYAGCMLWLVGAKTVGKAAIHGWTEVVRPARAAGAGLWPFDGDLSDLAADLVLAESYPADSCRQLGIRVANKNRSIVLSSLAPHILAWADARGIGLSAALHAAVEAGFSAFGARCGDAFDAVAGLLAALPVADGRRLAAPDIDRASREWEGWILGRAPPEDPGPARRVEGAAPVPASIPHPRRLSTEGHAMRTALMPAALALALLGAAPALAQTAPAAPAAASAPQADASQVRQIPLTPALIDQFVAAQKDVNAILDKLPDGTDQPDPATAAKLDATAQKYKFDNYAQFDTVETNIGIVMAGIDPQTKKYIGPEAVVKQQIAQVEGDKQISAKDKKDTVDQLNAALPTIPKLQYPDNADLVVQNYDKLNAAMPQD